MASLGPSIIPTIQSIRGPSIDLFIRVTDIAPSSYEDIISSEFNRIDQILINWGIRHI